MKIAGNLTIDDWTHLNKILDDNKTENCGTAFNFFKQRVKTRYLSPIDAIIVTNNRATDPTKTKKCRHIQKNSLKN
jgi:hypothetical protein